MIVGRPVGVTEKKIMKSSGHEIPHGMYWSFNKEKPILYGKCYMGMILPSDFECLFRWILKKTPYFRTNIQVRGMIVARCVQVPAIWGIATGDGEFWNVMQHEARIIYSAEIRRKLTVRSWKRMVGRRNVLLKWPLFRGHVNFRGVINSPHLSLKLGDAHW